MIKKYKKTAIVFLLCGIQIQSVFACKYNVRETGFIDLGSEPYFLYLCVDQNTSQKLINSFQIIATEILKDSNIKPHVVNIDFERNNVTIKYLNVWNIKSLPAVLLISPDGQSIILPVDFEKHLFEQSVDKVVKDILFSSAREHIIQKTIDTYGVIFLVEGKSENKNIQAREAVRKALKNIQQKMNLMPKHIKNPPEIVSLPNKFVKSEKFLLWSLGLDPEQIEEPVAAVIYGRARWIGPLFIGEKITRKNLTAILITIGLDCECGLDKSWIQGTRIPVKWDQPIQSRVAKNLGFDPENPMIKMEINRILRTGSYPGVPMNIFSEYLELDSSKQNTGESPLKESIFDSSNDVNPGDQSENSILGQSLFIILCLIILILVGGVIILFQRKE